MNQSQIENLVNKLASCRQMSHLDIQREVLDELHLIKRTLHKEIADNSQSQQTRKEMDKLNYQLKHLKDSYLKLFEENESRQNKLIEEKQQLLKQLENKQINQNFMLMFQKVLSLYQQVVFFE